MIYIDFSREKFLVDDNGAVLEQSAQPEGTAVFNDTSAIKENAEASTIYRYYSKHAGLLYCEKTTPFSRCKSLLSALNLRPEVLVGVKFSDGIMLLLAYIDGKVEKRLTSRSTGGSSSDQEITYAINDWWKGKAVPHEVYGVNLPFADLVSLINHAPFLKDRIKETKKRIFVQKVASAAMVVIALAVYAVVVLAEKAEMSKMSALRQARSMVQANIKNETLKKLPLYIDYISIPLDLVLKELSWLEGKRYATVAIAVHDGVIKGDVTVNDAGSAYIIKEAAGRGASVNIKGGVIDISFEKPVAAGGAAVSYSVGFRDLFNHK